ncbi:MAG: hypothetical protein COU33_02700 [Candidatus Magasanikbacteria bacterium CG10_big_fil_rev_8_21_14_0_10_43_6]|uniref:VOC domain-containing protein n=1 Tax=Candidatus Magasanikbacteria bacterium CG10_big_fil_rev_8_21_14_0_10_43_6 TaxID=1974650 RepID=A0A2M6W147_9BACT|nr:MAG: hypothetical protein COU33_02700 [Candidatus Magasanikbacteria bacterium CG10_big_fil_rev_8_21_14_0_10_43_6]
MHPIHNILGETDLFLDQLFAYLRADGISVSSYELDHVCYRVETEARYNVLKKKIAECGVLLSEQDIGERPIATYRLHMPIGYKERQITCIEVPMPKEGSFYTEGFEHAEFVIDVPFDAFMDMYPHISFSTRAIKKKVNPDISISYGSCSVKFHHATLEHVITYVEKH